jgi:hypothetical protein
MRVMSSPMGGCSTVGLLLESGWFRGCERPCGVNNRAAKELPVASELFFVLRRP